MHQTRLLAFLSVFASLLSMRPAAAQAPARVYEYTTLNVFESTSRTLSKIMITPAFQGKTEVQLEDFNAFAFEKNREKLQANAQTVNQTLGDLSAAGWELVQVYPLPSQQVVMTRYLLRKAKP